MAIQRNDDGRPLRFAEFIASTKWSDFDSYVERGQSELRPEIQRNVRSEYQIRERLRERICAKYSKKLRRVDSEQFKSAQATLQDHVVAVDGTRAQVQLLSGIRSQLGVVAVSYQNDRWTYVTYVTELTYNDFGLERDIEEIVDSRTKDDRAISDLVIRGALAYNERLRALQQTKKWRIVHGELFPFELRSGLGKLEALKPAMSLFRDMAQERTIGAVVSDTGNADLNYGFALEPREYFRLSDLKHEYDFWLENGAKFNPKDKARFQRFNDEVARYIIKGVYRVGARPFIFYAHEDVFDEFAALLIADSSMVPERGFPMLVDYADTVCANLFRAGDFERRVLHELALEGDVLAEQSERASRTH